MYLSLFIGSVLLALEFAVGWQTRQQRAVVRRWADAHGLKLLKFRQSSTFQSFETLINTRGKQSLFHITVHDPLMHRNRCGLARLDSQRQGLLDKDAVAVEWERS